MKIDDLGLRAGRFRLLQFEYRQKILKLFLGPRELHPDDRLLHIHALQPALQLAATGVRHLRAFICSASSWR
jgi:hypothetical protein